MIGINKTCNKCDQEKPLTEFYRNALSKDKHSYSCKKCQIIFKKKWQEENKERHKAYEKKKGKEYYQNNREKIIKRSTEYQLANTERLNDYKKRHWAANKVRYSEAKKINSVLNKEAISIKAKERYKRTSESVKYHVLLYRINNIDTINEKRRIDRSLHPEKYLAGKIRQYEKNKKHPLFKIKTAVRGRMAAILKQRGYRKNSRTEKILGTDFSTLKKYLERQFTKGMNWNNHGQGAGKWHIDHVIPLASAKTEDQVLLLCHYTNLQPLWGIDNIRKGSKIYPTQMKIAI